MPPHSNAAAVVLPYVPRIVVEWLATAPHERSREIDGTMVFVDVSGFTKLSERLARQGKVGAEDLTEILNRIFTGLLNVAYERGGGLIKFGGDALLLLFTGPAHAVRACAAAAQMRDELRYSGRVKTVSGTVVLRMSVGVHSGTFHFFLVGDSHRELLLSGPAATRTVEMEGAADAGEILVSPETAALIHPRALGREKGVGRLLRAAPPEPLSSAEPVLGVDDSVLDCVPVALRRHLLGGGEDPEHRQVVVAFLHFKGVDTLLAHEGPPSVAAALHELVVTVQEQVDAHDLCFLGSDIYDDGGKLILTAGAPHSTGSDEERMLRAARAVLDLDLTLKVRLGVNAGHVYAGDVGHPLRRTYTVMGDAVNLAARLMSAAPFGELYTTERVLRRSRTAFETRELEPFFVKGKSQPVQAFAVVRPLAPRTAALSHRHLLVGRDEEIRQLTEALAAARAGRGHVVELSGEPGIGKSRLVEEMQLRAKDLQWFRVTCDQYEATTPYHPVRSLLRQIIGVDPDAARDATGDRLRRFVRAVDPSLLPWLPLLAVAVDGDVAPTAEVTRLDEQFRKVHLERAVVNLLRVAVPEAAFVVEDAHWMDDASSDLLRVLASETATASWFLCTTRRDQAGGYRPPLDDHVMTMHLQPLPAGALQSLVDVAVDDVTLAPHELEELAARAGGNPLFLLELAAGVAEAGRLDALPDSIEAAVAARIDKLAPPDRALLRSAAVLGMAFPLDLLVDIAGSGRDGLVQRLEEFLQGDGRGQVRFRHALVRDAAYEALPFRRRRELHEHAGSRLEEMRRGTDDSAELIALHYYRAARYDKAWHYCRLAGQRAQAKSASVEAAKFYRQALEAAGKSEQRVTSDELAAVAEALGDVSQLAGFYTDSAWAYRVARRHLAYDPVRTADLLRKEGRLRDRSGRLPQARRWYQRGLRVVREHGETPELRRIKTRTEVLYAATLIQEGRYRACIRRARKAAEEARSLNERAVLAHAYYLLDFACTESGLDEGVQYRGLALPIYEELGDLVGQANVLNNLGMWAYWEGRWAEAVDLYRRSREAREKAGDLALSSMAATNIGEVLADQGRLDEAERHLREALRIVRSAGHHLGQGWVASLLGTAAARGGRLEEARSLFDDARRRFQEIGAEARVLEANARIAETELFVGEWRRALPMIEESLEHALRLGGLPFLVAALHRLHAYAVTQGGEASAALAHLGESERIARDVNAPFELALTLLARARISALLGEPDDAAAEECDEILRRLDVVAVAAIPLHAHEQVGPPPP